MSARAPEAASEWFTLVVGTLFTGEERLDGVERKFLRIMLWRTARGGVPTPRQGNWLRRIKRRIERTAT